MRVYEYLCVYIYSYIIIYIYAWKIFTEREDKSRDTSLWLNFNYIQRHYIHITQDTQSIYNSIIIMYKISLGFFLYWYLQLAVMLVNNSFSLFQRTSRQCATVPRFINASCLFPFSHSFTLSFLRIRLYIIRSLISVVDRKVR